ncbi:MAG: hypothetical protein ACO37Y_12390, partial [Steroidobacteraceae bacterium]
AKNNQLALGSVRSAVCSVTLADHCEQEHTHYYRFKIPGTPCHHQDEQPIDGSACSGDDVLQ